MKNVTNNFKTDIRTYGRQLDYKIKINNENASQDDFNYLKPSFNADLFKTVMFGLEIDSKNEIAKKNKINIEAGVKLNEDDYEYITYNTYEVKTCERQEDTLSYIVKAYDKMMESMIDYDLNLTQRMTVRNYLIRICQRLNWNTAYIPETFINSSKIIDPTLHIGIGYTFRDILDEIATITCSFILFIDDELHLIYPTETNEIIDESYLDEDNVIIGEKYIINSLVFSRAEESDNIYRKDNESINTNGLHEFRISDNQLLSTNERDAYIDEMFDYLKTFEFYTFDVKSKGILFLNACDRFSFVLGGKTYSTILLNDETTFEDGLTEDIYADEPGETETDYKCADETDRRINKTYILVDKQNQTITQLAEQQTDHEQRISKVTQDVSQLQVAISEITDMSRDETGNNTLHITDTVEGNGYVLNFTVFGSTTNMHYLTPEEGLVPHDGLVPNGGFITVVCDKKGRPRPSAEAYQYKIRLNEPLRDLCYVRDELSISNSGVVTVTRRLGTRNGVNGEVYELDQEVTETLEDIKIISPNGTEKSTNAILHTFEEETYIYIKEFYNLDYEIKYITQSDYSDQFVTKVDMEAFLKVTSQEILSNVSKTYATQDNLNNTETTLKSEIKQTADIFATTVSKKVGKDEIISSINQSAEEVQINANKISLKRKRNRFNRRQCNNKK